MRRLLLDWEGSKISSADPPGFADVLGWDVWVSGKALVFDIGAVA